MTTPAHPALTDAELIEQLREQKYPYAAIAAKRLASLSAQGEALTEKLAYFEFMAGKDTKLIESLSKQLAAPASVECDGHHWVRIPAEKCTRCGAMRDATRECLSIEPNGMGLLHDEPIDENPDALPLRYAKSAGNCEHNRAVDVQDAPAEQGSVMASEWQPISTAPKDGRFVLLHVPKGLESGVVTVGAYWKHEERAENGRFRKGNWDGWLGMDADIASSWCSPTHWQPLPAAPPPSGQEE